MPTDRLSQIEDQLELLAAQLEEKEVAKITALDGSKTIIQQQIDRHLMPQIRERRKVYAQILLEGSDVAAVTEPQAEIVVGEMVDELKLVKATNIVGRSDQEVELLEEILAKLNEPGTSAAIKLKGMLSPVPPFVGFGIEVELDTENFWQRNCPTFTSWAGKAKKLFPPA